MRTAKKEKRPVSSDSVGFSELPVRQAQALELLLQGRSIVRTANSLGIARSTVSTWLNDDPRFIALYTQGRRLAFETTINRVIAMSSKACEVLEEALADPERSFQAAKFILKLATLQGRVNRDPVMEDPLLVQSELYKLVYEASPWLPGSAQAFERQEEQR